MRLILFWHVCADPTGQYNIIWQLEASIANARNLQASMTYFRTCSWVVIEPRGNLWGQKSNQVGVKMSWLLWGNVAIPGRFHLGVFCEKKRTVWLISLCTFFYINFKYILRHNTGFRHVLRITAIGLQQITHALLLSNCFSYSKGVQTKGRKLSRWVRELLNGATSWILFENKLCYSNVPVYQLSIGF